MLKPAVVLGRCFCEWRFGNTTGMSLRSLGLRDLDLEILSKRPYRGFIKVHSNWGLCMLFKYPYFIATRDSRDDCS